MNADFLPLLIGSLPHTDVKKAVEAGFFACPRSPSWPQLPKLSPFEGMNLQYLEGIPGWFYENGKVIFKRGTDALDSISRMLELTMRDEADAFALTESFSKTFSYFIKKTAKTKRLELVKGQVIGPITFLTSHKTIDGDILIKDEIYKSAIPRFLGMKARYQVSQFMKAAPGKKHIIFFDEPVLSQIGSAVTSLNKGEVNSLCAEAFKMVNVLKGIHICGNSDWDFILDLPMDIVNLDAFNYCDAFLLYEQAIQRFIERGGYIALGIVPTDAAELKSIDEKRLFDKTAGHLKKLRSIIGTEMTRKRVFITPSCGMGTLTEAEAATALALLKNLSRSLQTAIQ